MKVGNLFLMCGMLCIMLPSCGPFSKKKVKEKKLSDDTRSVFFPLSEEYIRNDVRSQYASKEGGENKSRSVSQDGKKMSRKQKKIAACERARQQEARLADIPIPLNVEPLSNFFQHDLDATTRHASLGYHTDMSAAQVNNFFKREMERYGWQCMSDVSGPELFASFVKPEKFCAISIRPKSGKRAGSDIIIFAGPTLS